MNSFINLQRKISEVILIDIKRDIDRERERERDSSRMCDWIFHFKTRKQLDIYNSREKSHTSGKI